MKRLSSLLLSVAMLVALASLALAAAPRPWTLPTKAAASATATVEDDDPDMPAALSGGMDKGAYMQAREQYFIDRTDAPFDVAYQGRLNAVQQMKQQSSALAPFAIFGTWTPIGPYPIPNGQTTSFSTPVSGRVTCIVVHPTNPNIVYVGTAQGGVYRSLNGGTTWTELFDAAASLAIGALALAPSDPTILYVGTGESSGSCDSYFGVGLYRIDAADTAPVLNGPFNPPVATGLGPLAPFTGRAISAILVSPTDPAAIWVANFGGIGGISCDALSGTIPPLGLRGLYKSTNGTSGSPAFTKLTVSTANSIAPDVTGSRSLSDMIMDPQDPNKMVCYLVGNALANDGGIWVSSNFQSATPTWTQKTITAMSGSVAKFAASVSAGVTTFMCATGEGSAGRIRKSVDAGVTWSGTLAGGVGFCGGQCFYDIAIAMPPANPNVVLLGGSANSGAAKVYQRSINGGTSYTQSDGGLHADTHAVTIAPSDPNVVYFGSDGGVWRSNDGGTTWTSLNNTGFSATQFQSIAVHPTDANFSIGGTQDNGTNMFSPARAWNRIDFGDGGFTAIDQNATDNSTVTMYHTYFNQTNNLIGFARVDNVASAFDGNWPFYGFGGAANGISGSDAVLFYAPIALGPGNPNTMYFGTDRLYRSTNKGVTMTVVSQAPFVSTIPVSAIGISAQDDNVRLVGLKSGKIYATTTGSASMTDITGLVPAKYICRAVIDPTNSSVGYVTLGGFGLAAGQHIWKTTNLTSGAGWTAIGNGLPDVPVNAFVIDPTLPSHMYAGTDVGVYISTDAGNTWSPYNTGLPVVAVFDMAISAPNHILRIATHGRGMWERVIDAPVATQLALVGAEYVDGAAKLTWYSADGAREQMTLYRRPVPGDWAPLATLTADGTGQLSYADANVVPGRSYEYQVGVRSGTTERMLGQVWLDVPLGASFGIRSLTSLPARGPLQFAVTLTTAAPATLELVDLTGRRVASQDLSSLGVGTHTVQLADAARHPGIYWARVAQAGKMATTRVAVVR